ncbi:hypothetical protein L6164_004729 [Bauhinia variegata]|uniref:Uncharacterized protein n=1 Tax=Bauhinia variegata TaxID=167791 RepID=A0ACB9PP95_BAUVA|nr:hypothetical protein L6164_004729 [Bauhinia variegata]
MTPAAQHINVLRVVIRAEFSCKLAEHLVHDIINVLHYLQKHSPKHVAKVSDDIKEEKAVDDTAGIKRTALDSKREIIAQEANKRQKILAA